ncbi:alcohol dehydrogenase [Coccomyxa subellipsoidea C-169]|uniref:Alcohol dehydrogenase n=1 Tax=Coccomyxa subellipsoidea (strain C-169) TaxID=574566 RepID=I0Z024_COCSC|nr:alcohol dehydrogenase [Coccomyxa subellipsoidea C-169]EIE23993.1 alcohol dehydrogenase [Coccomyxa subellipsoidea C-169]|eukprot:XP_005648537.1 alcohol dehydrogenase [Coccomyxa subellipsoidea C-169]
MADEMEAIVFDTFGPPSVLKLVQYPKPRPRKGEVLVKIHAAGVNPVDYKIRKGEMMKFIISKPKIPGGDLSGVVENAPAESKWNPGQKVFALTKGFQPWNKDGTYAGYYAVKEEDLAAPPATMSFDEAGAMPLAALTAFQSLEAAGVKEGQRVLIHAGAGGVGTFAIQLAKARGAHVITTAGPRNLEFVTKELGADEVIEYTTQRFEDVLKSNPVDAVIDPVGGPVETRSYAVLKRRGHYQLILNEKTSPIRIVTGVAKGLLRMGPTYGITAVSPNGAQLQKISDMAADGKVKVILDRTYPLVDAPAAHEYLEQGHARGKVVLKVVEGS